MYRSFLALRYIRTRFVNLISVGGVMFGVAVLIVVTSVMDGFQERVRSVLRGNLSHLAVTPTGDVLPDLGTLTHELAAADPRIVGVAAQSQAPMGYMYRSGPRSRLSYGGSQVQILTAVGLDWEREKAIEKDLERWQGAKARDGSLRIVVALDPEDPFASEKARFVERTTVLVSRAFARTFRGAETDEQLTYLLDTDIQVELFIEDRGPDGRLNVRLYEPNLVISGIYDGGDQSEDRTRLLFRRGDLVRMAQLKEPYQELRVWLRDYDQALAVKQGLLRRFPDLVVETWEEQREDFLRAIKTEKVLLVIVLSFIVLLGGFIILATLTLTVVEKTRDIGVLAALGASRSGILSIFLRNGFFIGVIGSLLGLLLGWLFVRNINSVKAFFEGIGINLFPPDIYLFTQIPTVWSWVTAVTIMAGSVLVSFLAGLLPALRAARLDPVVALRHE